MKKMIFLCFVVLFLASSVWAQEKIEAPILNVGDKWTYKRADGQIYSNEVVKVTDDLFIIKPGEPDKPSFLGAYDRKTMNIKFIIDSSGKEGPGQSIVQIYDFPISVGKKWSGSTGGRWVYDNKIEAIEDISVPAGMFKAYKIYCFVENRAPGGMSGWIRYWYTPQVKAIVKRVYQKTRYWIGFYDAELISYELK